MFGTSSVQKPSEGALFSPNRPRSNGQNEEEQRSIETLWRRQRGVNRVEEARERRSGEIPVKTSARDPGREKPKGATSGSRTKHTWVARDSGKGQSPEAAARQAGPFTSLWKGIQMSERHVGSPGSETIRLPFERGTLRRDNPKSAAGMKQDWHGFEG